VSDDMKRCGKKTAMANFKTLSQHLLGGTEKPPPIRLHSEYPVTKPDQNLRPEVRVLTIVFFK
jgi:hypothetical protein